MIGGYFDRFHAAWDDPDLTWFEAVLDADEADVMAWAMGAPAPRAFEGPQLDALRRLDYVTAP
jgi:antitoxin CptB